MKLFGKKKDEDIEEEEDELDSEEELKDRKLTRKFKDLKPENKKSRKEPPKPWGKKERLIVGGFFLFTTISATVMFLMSHEFKFPGFPKITFNSFDLSNPFGEEIIQIGQKKNIPQDDARAKSAITSFDKLTKPLSGHYGFYVIRLGDGVSYGVSTESKFQGASILKLPLMILTYKLSEEKKIDLDTKYILKDVDKVKGSGVLLIAKEGTSYTYRELVKLMGKESDRTAYKVMKDIVGDSILKNFVMESGMKSTNIDSGETTPSNIGILLQKLWNNELVNEDNKKEILADLTNTNYEKWITAGVPVGISVTHKFGKDLGVMTDGGVVMAEEPYIIVIMGNGITNQDADKLFSKVSKDIYEVENSIQ